MLNYMHSAPRVTPRAFHAVIRLARCEVFLTLTLVRASVGTILASLVVLGGTVTRLGLPDLMSLNR